MSNVIECRSWNDLVEAFRAAEIYVDVNHADRDLIVEFVAELNDAGILFPSKRIGEMPMNPYMYYWPTNKLMYTATTSGLEEIKGRTCVSLQDVGTFLFAVQEVDRECLDALL